MAESYDAIVVGAGHNGLVCAAYLARAGLRTLVLERRGVLGGACVTEEVWPGYRVSTASYVMSLLQPKIIRELELPKFGFEVLPTDNLFVPFPDGRYFVYWDDTKKTCAEIAKFSRKDAETYPVFEHFLHDAAKFVRELLWKTPPNPASRRPGDLKEMIGLLWQFRKLGNRLFRFVDLMTESISDFLDRYFESDQLKAVLAYYGSIGTFAGPRTPGTAYVLLHHLMGEHEGAGGWGFIRGGMGGISQAIARSAERHGARVRADAEVARITVRDGRAVGVVLASGEEITARIVVSNADPRRTFLGMLGAGELPSEFVDEVRTYKTYSTAFKINLALDEAPRYTAFDAKAIGAAYPTYVHIGPSIEYLERAYDDAKYGRPSARPVLECTIPSVVDPSVAPPGRHLMSMFVQYAPYALREGTWDEHRDAFADRCFALLDEYAPNFSRSVLARQVLTPLDLERVFGLTGGNIFQGAMTPNQLFSFRPVPGWAQYRTPIRGLYLCGAAAHPGGGVMGAPGLNAAREILGRRWPR
jgi:phytoene dehydrogenase-like protein